MNEKEGELGMNGTQMKQKTNFVRRTQSTKDRPGTRSNVIHDKVESGDKLQMEIL